MTGTIYKHYTWIVHAVETVTESWIETAAVSACPNTNIDVHYVELQVYMNTVQ